MDENFAKLVSKGKRFGCLSSFNYFMSAWRDRVGDLTLFEALMGGAFDHLNWQHSGEFDQNFSKKSNALGFAQGEMGGFGIDQYIKTKIQIQDSVYLPLYLNVSASAPLLESRVAFREGPQKNRERANLALYFYKAAYRLNPGIVFQ